MVQVLHAPFRAGKPRAYTAVALDPATGARTLALHKAFKQWRLMSTRLRCPHLINKAFKSWMLVSTRLRCPHSMAESSALKRCRRFPTKSKHPKLMYAKLKKEPRPQKCSAQRFHSKRTDPKTAL